MGKDDDEFISFDLLEDRRQAFLAGKVTPAPLVVPPPRALGRAPMLLAREAEIMRREILRRSSKSVPPATDHLPTIQERRTPPSSGKT